MEAEPRLLTLMEFTRFWFMQFSCERKVYVIWAFAPILPQPNRHHRFCMNFYPLKRHRVNTLRFTPLFKGGWGDLNLTLSALKTRRFYKEFQSISLSYPSFRHCLKYWVLALILFAITGRIISDKRNFPRVPR
jgi:hypothetical protein